MNKPLFLVAGLLLFITAIGQHLQGSSPYPKEQTKDTLTYIQNLISLGKKTGKKDTAYSLKALSIAASEAGKIHHNVLEAKSYYAIGDIFFNLRIYNRALPNYSRSADLYYETKERKDFALALLGVAKSQYYRGNYKRASESFVEVIKTSEKTPLPEITSEANEYLGLIYGAFQNVARNTTSNIKSLDIKKKLNDEKGIIRVAGNLGQIYYHTEKYDSAIIYANLAFVTARKLNMRTDMYMAQFTKTASLIRLHKWVQAEEGLRFFHQIEIPLQDANLKIHYQTLLGNLYLEKNDEVKSRLHYDSALGVIRQYSFPELLIIVYGNMAGSYFANGDLRNAYKSFQKYNEQLSFFYSGENLAKLANLEGLVFLDASKDEIKHLNNENQLKALLLSHEQDVRYNLAVQNQLKDSILKKEKLLNEALAKENKYKQKKLIDERELSNVVSLQNQFQFEKLNNEKRLRTYLLSGLVLLIISGAVIFFMYKRQKTKSSIIQIQSEELKTLMKEIHHRVKNNLQIISSLLDLQSLSIKDKHASGAVREGKLRVQSMALIHQNLYNEENVKGIEMKDYVNNLVENLFNSYNIQRNNIRLITDIDHLNLDVDTVIPLGLIINELINNSLKYAFKGKENGEIYVALKEHDQQLELRVNDNGCGFPPAWNSNQNNSFGFKLIKSFAQKLKASIEVYNNNGACVSMSIFKYKVA